MKKLIALIIVAFCICTFFVGCSSSISKGENVKSIDEFLAITKPDPYRLTGSNIFEDGFYILADFETYGEVIQPLYGNSFGKVKMITDSQYVKRGKQPVRLEIAGTEFETGTTNPYIGFYTNSRYFQKSDFSDCDYLEIDIFNAQDEDATIMFSTYHFVPNYPDKQLTIVLQPGWNDVIIDASKIWQIEKVEEFMFVFDRGELHEERQVFYMDNFRAHKKEVV